MERFVSTGLLVPAVDIMIGGKLVAESQDAHTVLRGIPLELAKYYVEELVLEYKRLKKQNESFERFNERVLSKYSYGALAFMMSYNYIHKTSPKLLLDENPKTLKHEAFEIFHFGERIYRLLEDKNPYGIVKNFAPIGSNVKRKGDDKVSDMVNKMIASDESRAEVFTELLIDINKF